MPSQTGKSNLLLREGMKDISNVLWQWDSETGLKKTIGSCHLTHLKPAKMVKGEENIFIMYVCPIYEDSNTLHTKCTIYSSSRWKRGCHILNNSFPTRFLDSKGRKMGRPGLFIRNDIKKFSWRGLMLCYVVFSHGIDIIDAIWTSVILFKPIVGFTN